MSYTVWGDVWEAGQLSNTDMSVKLKPTKDLILKGCRTWIIVYNNPTFTNLSMKIYSNGADGLPGALITTSTDVRTKAEIHTDANAVKEIYFQFDNVQLEANDYYHFVMAGTGYSYSGSSYLAWKKAWPDPVLGGYTPTSLNYLVAPYDFYIIAGEF